MDSFTRFMSKLGAIFMALCFVTAFSLATPEEAKAGEIEAGADLGYVAQLDILSSHGFGITVYGGYRIFDWMGVYVDQLLGGVWLEDYAGIEPEGIFVGSTVLNARFFMPINHSIELWGQIGIGAGYLAVNEASDEGFAFKAGVGAMYALTHNLSLGAKFAYQLFANRATAHNINVAITLNYKI